MLLAKFIIQQNLAMATAVAAEVRRQETVGQMV
jgi:hypothetical protein